MTTGLIFDKGYLNLRQKILYIASYQSLNVADAYLPVSRRPGIPVSILHGSTNARRRTWMHGVHSPGTKRPL